MADQFLNTPSNTLIVANVKTNKGAKTESFVLGAVQQFAYQVQRQKAPIYVIGSTNPITIAKGARQVAGTLQGVILGEDFQFSLIKYFWNDIASNSIQRVNGKDDINQEFGNMTAFVNHFAIPMLKQIGINPIPANVNDGESSVFNFPQNKKIFDRQVGIDQLNIPPLYLDEIPPITLSLITPIDITEAGLKYETVTLYGLEFVSNDLAIQAGREQIFESVNFIQTSVAKSISTQTSEQSQQTQRTPNVTISLDADKKIITVNWSVTQTPSKVRVTIDVDSTNVYNNENATGSSVSKELSSALVAGKKVKATVTVTINNKTYDGSQELTVN